MPPGYTSTEQVEQTNRRLGFRLTAGVAAVLVAALVAYWPPIATRIGYVWDDVETVRDNPVYNQWSRASLLFTPGYFEAFRELSYRPVASFSFFVDRSLWGESPVGSHFVHIGLLALSSLLVFALAWRLTRNAGWSAVAGVLYAVHPIHAEAVDVLAFREDLLATVFAAAAVLVFLPCLDRERRGAARLALVGGSALLFALAVLSKESAAPLPLVLLLGACLAVEGEGRRGRALLWTIPHWIVLAGFVVVRFVLFRSPEEQTLTMLGGGPVGLLTGAAAAYAHNVRMTVLPWGLSVEYALPTGLSLGAAVGLLLLAATVVGILLLRRREPAAAFGLLWFLLMLAPTSNLYPLANPLADRYLYLPSLGLILAFAAGLRHSDSYQPYAVALVIFVALFGTLLTIQRSAEWARSGSEPVWRSSLRVNPDGTSLRATLAGFYSGRQSVEKARQQWTKAEAAFRKTPADGSRQAYLIYNLGVGAMQAGDAEGARRLFEQVLAVSPDFAAASHNIAILDLRAKAYGDAEKRLHDLVQTHPDYIDAWLTLGDVYRARGKPATAVIQYRQAMAHAPESPAVLKALGSAQIEAGDKEDAIETFAELCRLRPRSAEAAFLLGAAYDAAKDRDAALKEYTHAVSLDPRFGAASNSIGSILYRRGQYREAAEAFRRAARLDPRMPATHYNLATCLRALGEREEAIAEMKQALALAPPGDPLAARVRRELDELLRSGGQSAP